ncbi:MAG: SRPBCC domain-containing protein [Terracidiphilus sp.]
MKSSYQITRRQALAGTAAGIALSVSRLSALAQQPTTSAQQPDTSQKPAKSPNQTRTSLHQEIEWNAPPERIFHILLNSKEFTAVTGMAAAIDPNVGGAFNTFSGLIEGRNIEIVPSSRIIQAWRLAYWPPGVYSLVHFELKASTAPNTSSTGTTLVLDHTGFPEGDFDHLDPGWYMRYWDPMKKIPGRSPIKDARHDVERPAPDRPPANCVYCIRKCLYLIETIHSRKFLTGPRLTRALI